MSATGVIEIPSDSEITVGGPGAEAVVVIEPDPGGGSILIPPDRLGMAGPPGDTGPPGVVGPQGPPGTSEGLDGPPGPTGAQGMAGNTGPQGSAGPTGPNGPAGFNWRGAWNASTNYAAGDAVSYNSATYYAIVANVGEAPVSFPTIWGLVAMYGSPGNPGPNGSTGPLGVTGPTGAQGPTGSQGQAGVASTVPGPQGPTGATGPRGPTGPQSTVPGPQGNPGPTGPAGQPGPQSTTPGPTGPQGSRGPQGPAGPASTVPGPTGPTGPAGTVTGPTGVDGAKGPTGNAGPTGASGTAGSKGLPAIHRFPLSAQAYRMMPDSAAVLETTSITAYRWYAYPLWAPDDTTITKASINITGSGSSTIIAGIYNCLPSYGPGALRLDLGSFSGNTNGIRENTYGPALVLPAGLYWTAVMAYGALTNITVVSINGAHVPNLGVTGLAGAAGQGFFAVSVLLNGVTTLPDPFPTNWAFWNNYTIMLSLRFA